MEGFLGLFFLLLLPDAFFSLSRLITSVTSEVIGWARLELDYSCL